MNRTLLSSAYIFYKWDKKDTFNNVLEKCDDNTNTIHTEVSFYKDEVILTKTNCKIFDPKKHILKISYDSFVDMMNKKEKIEGQLYDWEVIT